MTKSEKIKWLEQTNKKLREGIQDGIMALKVCRKEIKELRETIRELLTKDNDDGRQ